MNANKKILNILSELRPEHNFAGSTNYISDGLLDSFDLVMLVDALEKEFSIKISGEHIIAENFSNTETIAAIVNNP